MFLLMVGIALIRKPYAATAMVLLNFLLMQLLFSGVRSNVLWWPYGIYQGLSDVSQETNGCCSRNCPTMRHAQSESQLT